MIVIGFGNAILFREANGQMPSFDNTFVKDEDFLNTLINSSCQAFFEGDPIEIIAKVATGETPAINWYDNEGNSGALGSALITSYTSYDFYKFTHTLGVEGKKYYYIATNATDPIWQSEPIEVVEDSGNFYKWEWFNLDPVTGRVNNNFEVDYSQGFTPFLRIEGIFKDYEPKTEIKVYDNLSKTTKLKEKIQRTIEFKTGPIPRWMAEKLVIASAHDNFYINEVQFVREEKPELKPLENNQTELSMILTQATVQGLNSTDLGFDCDTIMTCKVSTLVQTGVSANTSFTIPEGHLLQTITVIHSGLPGTNTICEFGRAVGDDDIGTINVSPNAIGVYTNNARSVTKNILYSPTGNGDLPLYVEVTGNTPNCEIRVTLIDIEE